MFSLVQTGMQVESNKCVRGCVLRVRPAPYQRGLAGVCPVRGPVAGPGAGAASPWPYRDAADPTPAPHTWAKT